MQIKICSLQIYRSHCEPEQVRIGTNFYRKILVWQFHLENFHNLDHCIIPMQFVFHIFFLFCYAPKSFLLEWQVVPVEVAMLSLSPSLLALLQLPLLLSDPVMQLFLRSGVVGTLCLLKDISIIIMILLWFNLWIYIWMVLLVEPWDSDAEKSVPWSIISSMAISDKYEIPRVAINENVAFLYRVKCSSLVALEGHIIFICEYLQSDRS